MRRFLTITVMLLTLGFLSGCGSDRDKGKYKDQDRQRSTDDK